MDSQLFVHVERAALKGLVGFLGNQMARPQNRGPRTPQTTESSHEIFILAATYRQLLGSQAFCGTMRRHNSRSSRSSLGFRGVGLRFRN